MAERDKSQWVRVRSRSRPGKVYYFNKVTKQTCWKAPPGLNEEPAVHERRDKQQPPQSNGSVESSTESHSLLPASTSSKSRPPALELSLTSLLPPMLETPAESLPFATTPSRPRPPALQLAAAMPMLETPVCEAPAEEMMDCEKWVGDEDVVEMDIELSPKMQEEMLMEMSSTRQGTVFSSSVESFTLGSDTIPFLYSESLYIVLDTNVLISHRQFLIELRDTPIKGVGRPVLVIPWVVMQELDALKTRQNHQLAERARKAIRFLNDCFSSKHRRVRAQTVEEVQTEVINMSISNNDDRILHCCLLYDAKVRGHGGVVVLFSNDVHLCSKALVNNVRALNRKTLIVELRTLCKNNQMSEASSYTHTQEFASRVNQQLKHTQQEAIRDDLLCESQKLLRDGLTAIVEEEFKAAFDDLWIRMLIVKPPWSLKDLLHIMDKHWIAVFGMIVDRSLKHTVDSLKRYLDRQLSRHPSFQEIEMFQNDGLTLLRAYGVHSEYGGVLPVCIAQLAVLSTKTKEVKAGKVIDGVISSPQIELSPKLPPTPPAASLDELRQMAGVVPPTPEATFQWALNLILETVKHCISLVNVQTVHTEETSKFLSQMTQLLMNLVDSIHSLLNAGYPPYMNTVGVKALTSSICDFFTQSLGIECPITADLVCKVVGNEKQVEILKQAVIEYKGYVDFLQQLAAMRH